MKRETYLDDLKIFLTVLVIFHHVGQAYGPTGGFWQYHSSMGESTLWLGSFFAVNAAFFMGLFFFMSGYVLPVAYEKLHGGVKPAGLLFAMNRLNRLGFPLLVLVLCIVPAEMYFYYALYSGNAPLSFIDYYSHIYLGIGGPPEGFRSSIGYPELNFGHGWYIEHLLIYSLIYAGLRDLIEVIQKHWKWNRKLHSDQSTSFQLKSVHLILIVVLLSVCNGIVRQFYPIDTWTALFGFIQSEPAHLPQYLIFFVGGIFASRKGILHGADAMLGRKTLFFAGLMIGLVYARHVLPLGYEKWLFSNWWWFESILAVSLSVGLLILFRDHAKEMTPFRGVISKLAFSAYVIHFPVVLTIQYAFDKVNVGGATLKFLIVGILSTGMTFLLAYLWMKSKAMLRFKISVT